MSGEIGATAPGVIAASAGLREEVLAHPSGHGKEVLAAILLAGLTLATYAHVCGNGFVYDDDDYVVANRHVHEGLSVDNAAWALTAFHAANWHPLTWLSLQLDATLFGLRPWGYHLHNLLLHTVDTLLLFLALRWGTGALWRSALVAGLFALHPLHVESVAWISERKDVLSALFWMLALLAYGWYARRPSWGRYLLVVLAFALGLLAKPMVVTLPCVLLLLDYWPLRRWEPEAPARARALRAPRLILEKLPLFLLSAGSCVLTWLAQDQRGAVLSLASVSWWARLDNALVAYVAYLGKTVWPAGLAAHYPHPGSALPVWQAAAAALLLAGVTTAAVLVRRRAPYLLVGWLWYVGTLVPVIGLVQVGRQAMADRYTYLPLIGIFVAVSWGLADLAKRWRCRDLVTGAAAVALAVCALLTWLQVRYWHDEVKLWTHAREVTANNDFACYNLAIVLGEHGDLNKACELYREAIDGNPSLPEPHYNLGLLEAKLGNPAEAERQYLQAIHIKPDYAEAYHNLGRLLARQGRLDAAAEQYVKALDLKPNYAEAHNDFGALLARQGRFDDAARQYTEAVRLKPDSAEAHYNLGVTEARRGNPAEAERHYATAVRLKPDYAEAHNNLAVLLLAQGQLDLAAQHFAEVLRLLPEDAESAAWLGVVRERQGRLPEAAACHRSAVALAPGNVRYHLNLALVLHDQGETEAARVEYDQARRLDPNWPRAANTLARRLATSRDPGVRDGTTALRLARQVCQATGDKEPAYLGTLAAAHAELGQFEQAVTAAQRAFDLAAAAGDTDLANQAEEHLCLYQARQPLREGP